MDKNNLKTKVAKLKTNLILKHRFKWLLALVIILIFSFFGMQRVSIDTSNESFFPDDYPLIREANRFEELFGNEEFVFVLAESEEVFSTTTLKQIRDLSQTLEEEVPFVDEVTSITNIEQMKSEGNNLIIEDLVGEEIPTKKEELTNIKDEVLTNPNYVGRFITEDSQRAAIMITFETIPEAVYIEKESFSPFEQSNYKPEEIFKASDIYSLSQIENQSNFTRIEDPRKLIAPAVQVTLDEHQTDDFRIRSTGMPILDYEVDRVVGEETIKFGLISLLVCIILMIVIFRSFRATMGPFLVISFSLIILYGLMGWLGISISMGAIIVPTLILVISVSYSIHLINHFQYKMKETGSRWKAAKYAYQEGSWPILITAFTTAIGFISFILVPIKPIREIGLICATGVVIAYLLTMIVLPCILTIGKDKNEKVLSRGKTFSVDRRQKIMSGWADWISDHIGVTVIISLLLVIPLIYFSLNVEPSSDMVEMIGDDFEAAENMNYITDYLGGAYSNEILIELPEKNMAEKPDVLNTVDSLIEEIKELESTVQVFALTDLVKELNKVMEGNEQEFYRLPESREKIAQYFLLYEMAGGDELDNWMDFDYQRLRVSAQVDEMSSDFQNEFARIVNRNANQFPEGTEVSIVGDGPLMIDLLDSLLEGQAKSILAALVIITGLMVFILKSVKLGLISMIANFLPVLVVTGLMGFLGFPLDILTILIAPMIIGIAVDDTVHYFLHFREEYDRVGYYKTANRKTFIKIGWALVFTSLVLGIGFTIFGFSQINSLIHLGILSLAGIFTALLADLLVSPAVILLFKPFGEEN